MVKDLIIVFTIAMINISVITIIRILIVVFGTGLVFHCVACCHHPY